MKYVLLFLCLSCASDRHDYKMNSSDAAAAMEEESVEQGEAIRDQFPTTQPATNQSPSF